MAGFSLLFLFSTAHAQTLEETQERFRRGDYENVIQAAQKKTGYGMSTDWQVLLVQSLFTVGRYAEAYTNAVEGVDRSYGEVRMLLLARETALFQNGVTNAQRYLAEIKNILERRNSTYPSGENLVAVGQAFLLLGVEPRLVLENTFRRAEKMEPPTREAFLASGQLALDKHDFALAAESFRVGLKKFPDDPDLLGGLAQAFETGDREEMLKNIRAALKTNPKHIPSLLLLAEHLIDAEQYEGAAKQLTAILKINPHRPEALAYRAVLAHLQNDAASEEKFRAAALQFWKTNPQVDFLIGQKLSQKYRFTEGAAAQKRALAFDQNYLPARRQLAQDLLRLGQNDAGWKLAEAIHKENEYDMTAYNLSMLHEAMEKFQTLTNAEFVVRMSPLEAKLYGDRVLDLLGHAREKLCRKYGVELSQPTTVEIFPNQKDFAVRTFGMPDNPGYLGVCFGSVVTANSPAAQAPHPANWEAVLWHEFCHVVTLTATKNRMPRWFSEGISVYEERAANPAWGEQMSLAYREMILSDDLKKIQELSGAFLIPKTPRHLQFAYYESSLVIEFLVEHFGLDAIKKILGDLRDGEELYASLAARTAPLPEIEKQFAEFIIARANDVAPKVDLAKMSASCVIDIDPVLWEKTHPNNYYLRMRQAKDLMQSKHWTDAKPLLEKLAADYHGENRADNPWWLLAVAQKNLNDTDAEFVTLQKLAQQESDFVDLFLRLIELSETRQEWSEVTKYSKRLLAVNPFLSAPYRALAKAGVASGKNDQAIVAYRKLLLLDPADPAEVHFDLARLLHARGGAQDEAKQQVLQALEEAPRFRDAQRLLLELDGNAAKK